MASRKMAIARILGWKCKLCFELPENSVLRLHKVQYRNRHYGSERLQDLHCASENPKLGIFLMAKQMNWRRRYDCMYLLIFIC